MNHPAIATPIPASSSQRRPIRWLARIAMMLGGLSVGLGAAEAVFYYRDGGAFPHLNIYVADAELGVRLSPGATENIAFGGNPVTHVQTNRDGYRGDELPAPGPDDVLVVGDSQVFGLGVEQDETFSAVLAQAIGRHVMNGGVPTYGPAEYRAVIAEQLAKRHPRTVVLTINLVNDLFEAKHPNRDRHAVWDGWAVRKETAPDSITRFPGRDLLYRRSHLFFALRKWRHADDANDNQIDERGVASEGTWKDIVSTGEQVRKQRIDLDAAHQKRLEDVSWLHNQVRDQERALDTKINEVLRDSEGADSFTSSIARAHPGDIVRSGAVESSRRIITTAGQIATAAAVRARLRSDLVRWANSHKTGAGKQALAALDARDQALTKLSELDVQKLQAALEPPLGGYIRDVKQLVEGAGARLVVVILPIDVQVSAEEWKKYGAKPIDMEPSKALTAELFAMCRAHGLSVLDATPVLAAAEPGAFLDKDIHMTPRGHAAVAAALARTLAEAPPPSIAATDRSPIPLPAVWREASEVTVIGAHEAACETKQVREWLRVLCSRTSYAAPNAVDIERDDGHEALAMVMPDHVSLVIPIVSGRDFAARITWTDGVRVLHVRWPTGASTVGAPRPAAPPNGGAVPSTPMLALDPQPVPAGITKNDRPSASPIPGPTAGYRSPVEHAICDCWQAVFGGTRLTLSQGDVFTCPGAYGAADDACVERYYRAARRCPELVACIRRDPASPP